MDDHLDDRPHPASLLADEPPAAPSRTISAEAFERLPSLSFSRSMRNPAWRALEQRKHERPAGAWREDEEGVASAQSRTTCARRAARRRPSGRRGRLVRAHVRAALALGHRHPAERGAARQPAEPDSSARSSRCPQRRTAANVIERQRRRSTSPRSMNAAARVTCVPALVHPRKAVHLGFEPEREQRPTRDETDLVDPLPYRSCVRSDRRVLVRRAVPLQRLPAERPAQATAGPRTPPSRRSASTSGGPR